MWFFKVLGNISEADRARIEDEIDSGIDPALSLTDIASLLQSGLLDPIKIAKRYNPEMSGMSDDEIRKWIAENMELLRLVPEVESDFL